MGAERSTPAESRTMSDVPPSVVGGFEVLPLRRSVELASPAWQEDAVNIDSGAAGASTHLGVDRFRMGRPTGSCKMLLVWPPIVSFTICSPFADGTLNTIL